jgi:hypothetical protein
MALVMAEPGGGTATATPAQRWKGCWDPAQLIGFSDGLKVCWDIAETYADGVLFVQVAGRELFRREWNKFNSKGNAMLYPFLFTKLLLNWELVAESHQAKYAYEFYRWKLFRWVLVKSGVVTIDL